MANWKRFVCYTVGCKLRPADDGSRGIAGAFECARCGERWRAVEWPKVPSMPACKPPRTEQADRIQALHLAAGDTLIITTNGLLSFEQRAHIKAQALEFIPDGCKVMVLHGGLEVGGTISARDVNAEALARLDAHNLT